jgi:hypothetical protein
MWIKSFSKETEYLGFIFSIKSKHAGTGTMLQIGDDPSDSVPRVTSFWRSRMSELCSPTAVTQPFGEI